MAQSRGHVGPRPPAVTQPQSMIMERDVMEESRVHPQAPSIEDLKYFQIK